jgi:hypothetical protein
LAAPSLEDATSGADASNAGAGYSRSFTNGTQYTLTLFAKASGSNFATFEIGYSNNNSSDTACLTGQTVVTGGWTRYSCTFTYTGSTGTSYIYVKQTDSTNRSWYVDGVKLEIAAAATPYREGSLALNGAVSSPTTFQNAADSTMSFQIQNAAGTGNLLVADTLNGKVGIGQLPTASGGRLQVSGNVEVSGTYNGNTFSNSALTFSAASTASIDSASGQALEYRHR